MYLASAGDHLDARLASVMFATQKWVQAVLFHGSLSAELHHVLVFLPAMRLLFLIPRESLL